MINSVRVVLLRLGQIPDSVLQRECWGMAPAVHTRILLTFSKITVNKYWQKIYRNATILLVSDSSRVYKSQDIASKGAEC